MHIEMHTNPSFEWDDTKNEYNIRTHGISFDTAQDAFYDPDRIIAYDVKHSTDHEKHWFCNGRINKNVVTVRFTYRNNQIRIFGAGWCRPLAAGEKTI